MTKPAKSDAAAVIIIISAFTLAVFSARGDSVTTDESPHIAAGYSYLTQRDMRFNPEHPPLVKDLAALPLFFQKINLDTEHYSWKNDINGQWAGGSHFLYESGNDPDKIAFAARLAVMALFVLLSWLVYRWGREKYGSAAGLLALALTVFSPNIIAHGRYVTTDVGATFAFVLAIYFFVKYINNPLGKHLIYAGLAFGLAQLIKFSLVLLIPLYLFIFIVLCYVKHSVFDIRRSAAAFLLILVIGYALVWPVYQFHVWNYPPERQKQDIEFTLRSYPFRPAADAVLWLADKPLLRPYAQYGLGLLMVFQRAGGGNTTYFMGEVSSTAWKNYFPIVYALKEPIPILILVLLAALWAIQKTFLGIIKRKSVGGWISNNPAEFTWLSFVIFYWATSINGNLNIGLRHVLPTFPFIYLLTAGQIKKWTARESLISARPVKLFLVTVLTLWLAVETVATYPYYLAYFNELAGGPANGYKYVADSNLDWGQDLKRLAQYVEKNKISKIKLDYFGGGNPEYYLGDKYERLDANNSAQRHGWLAVSATLLQNGRAAATKGFDQNTTYYKWLDQYKPVAQIGYSIFVYRID